jgi:hypothetical protein
MEYYGKPFIKDGVEWVHTLPWWQRPLYRVTVGIQWTLWKIGLPWHNIFFDECTPDFNCCVKKR